MAGGFEFEDVKCHQSAHRHAASGGLTRVIPGCEADPPPSRRELLVRRIGCDMHLSWNHVSEERRRAAGLDYIST
jgi:hypothetical protein